MIVTGFDRFVWAATFYGQVVLAFVLFVRGRAKAFPVFTAYIVQGIAATVVNYLVFLRLSQFAYFYTYWSLAVVDEIFQFLVFCELAFHVFCPTGRWAADVRRTFFGLISVSVVSVLLLTCLSHPEFPRLIQRLAMRSNFFSAMLMSELFVGTLVLSVTAGLPWKTHAARIAQGLGAFSLVCVAKDILSNGTGVAGTTTLYPRLAHIQVVSYLVCEVFWIVTLWVEAPAPRELPESMRTQIYTLQKQVQSDLLRIRDWRRN